MRKMKYETIDDLIQDKKENINKDDIEIFLSKKLEELYGKQREEPLFDYSEIKYSAMIDLIYEIMPSLRRDI
jgi:hypothetical protein